MDTITWSRLERLVARVAGDDPAAFLDATTTQDLTGLTAGRSVLTCMLDEKGHVQAELRATMLDDSMPLRISSVSSTRIAAVLPQDLSLGAHQLTIERSSGPVDPQQCESAGFLS